MLQVLPYVTSLGYDVCLSYVAEWIASWDIEAITSDLVDFKEENKYELIK